MSPGSGHAGTNNRFIVFCSHLSEDVIRKVSLLKRNAMAAPFERAFDAQSLAEKEDNWDPSTSQLMTIHYRDGEAIYVQNQQDRVTVIFSTLFKEETDRVYAKVFLQVKSSTITTMPQLEPTWHRTLKYQSLHQHYLVGVCWCQKEAPSAKCPPGHLLPPRATTRDPPCPWPLGLWEHGLHYFW